MDDNRTVLVAECKWKNEKMGADQLDKLNKRARLVGADETTPRWLFSRSGFTAGCAELANQMGNARLIAFGDMVASSCKNQHES